MIRHPEGFKKFRRAAAVVGVVALGLVGVQAPAEAAVTTYSASGKAYGTQVSVGSVVKSGPTAIATLGCSTVPDRENSNNTLVTNLAAGSLTLGSTGTTVNTVKHGTENGRQVVVADSDVQNVKIDGVISADVLHGTAKALGGPLEGSATMTFVNLKILGLSVLANPAPNTKVSLGALGYVMLNEQKVVVTKSKVVSTVSAMRVHLIDQPGFVSPIDIVIGYAQAQLAGPTIGVMEGYAYGTNLKLLGGIVKSGKTSLVDLPCLGTNGVVKTNSILTLSLPDLLTSGTIASTAVGTRSSTTTAATVSNVVEGVNLLGGVIKADVVKTELSGTRADNAAQQLTDNSVFVGLTINGTPYGGTPPPNTKIVIPGVGTLWLHRVVVRPDGMTEVRSIELILSAAAGGLPIGTNIKVGVAGLHLHE